MSLQNASNSPQSLKFLEAAEIIKILVTPSKHMLEIIPKGTKENVYFLVKNKENTHRRTNVLQSCFVDECGA